MIALCLPVIFHERRQSGNLAIIHKLPVSSSYTFSALRTFLDCRRASNLSCRLVQMEKTALTNKPDFSLPVRDHLRDSANKLAITVIAVMSKGFASRDLTCRGRCQRCQTKYSLAVLHDAGDVSATDSTQGCSRHEGSVCSVRL